MAAGVQGFAPQRSRTLGQEALSHAPNSSFVDSCRLCRSGRLFRPGGLSGPVARCSARGKPQVRSTVPVAPASPSPPATGRTILGRFRRRRSDAGEPGTCAAVKTPSAFRARVKSESHPVGPASVAVPSTSSAASRRDATLRYVGPRQLASDMSAPIGPNVSPLPPSAEGLGSPRDTAGWRPVDQLAGRSLRRDHQQPRPGDLATGERTGSLGRGRRSRQALSDHAQPNLVDRLSADHPGAQRYFRNIEPRRRTSAAQPWLLSLWSKLYLYLTAPADRAGPSDHPPLSHRPGRIRPAEVDRRSGRADGPCPDLSLLPDGRLSPREVSPGPGTGRLQRPPLRIAPEADGGQPGPGGRRRAGTRREPGNAGNWSRRPGRIISRP